MRVLYATTSLAISGLLLYLTFRGIDFAAVQASLARAKWAPLAVCLLVQAVSFWLAALRSRELLRPLGLYRIRDTLRAFLAYVVANNILPLRLGELVRADLLARCGDASLASSIVVLGIERMLDLLFLVVLFAAVAPYSAGEVNAGYTAISLIVVLVSVTLLGRWAVDHKASFQTVVRNVASPFGHWLRDALVRWSGQAIEGLSVLRSGRLFSKSAVLTALYWGTMLVNVYLWFVAFDLQLPWYAVPIVLLFVSIGHLIPSAPSGVGTYHFFCAASLRVFGVDQATAASVSLVSHAITVVPVTIVSMPFVLRFVSAAWRSRDRASVEPAARPAG